MSHRRRAPRGGFPACAILVLLCAWVGVGCAVNDVAQLVVVVQTDMTIPDEIDTVRIEVLEPDGSVVRELRDLDLRAGRNSLPLSFGIAPFGGDINRRVHLRVSAIHNRDVLFQTEVRTGFVSQRVNRLDVYLASMCRERVCSRNLTCRRFECEEIDISTSDLELYVPDAGMDGGSPDSGWDAGTFDASTFDAGPDAACPVRGPTIVTAVDPPASICEIGVARTCPDTHDCEAKYGSTAFCSPQCTSAADCVGFGTGAACDSGFTCTVPCDPYTNEGCPAGTVCGLIIEYINECGVDRLNYVTACRAFNATAVVGDVCGDIARTDQANCGSMQFCASDQCAQLCETAADCTGGMFCCPLRGAEGGQLIGGRQVARCWEDCRGLDPL